MSNAPSSAGVRKGDDEPGQRARQAPGIISSGKWDDQQPIFNGWQASLAARARGLLASLGLGANLRLSRFQGSRESGDEFFKFATRQADHGQ